MVFWEDPFEEIERMRRRLTRLMQRLGEPVEEEITRFYSFPVDIIEEDEELVVRADLPGFSKEEIVIRVTENTIEIGAQHKEKKIEKTEKMLRAERRFGSLKRALTLPAEVIPESSTAKFENGVLEVRLKKTKKKKVKEIKVE